MTGRRQKKKAVATTQRELPLPPPDEVPALGQVVDWYLRKHIATKARLTQKSNGTTFGQLLEHFGPLAKLMPGDVRDWLAERVIRNEVLPTTANLRLSHVHRMYVVAQKERWPLLRNAGTGQRFQKHVEAPRALKDPLTTFPRLLAAMPDDTWRAFLCVQRNLGLRKAEACGLEAKHVRLNAPGGAELHVEQQRDGKFCKASLKMYARPRTLKLDGETLRYLKSTLKERLKEGPGKGEVAGFIFPWWEDQLVAMMNTLRAVSPEDFPKTMAGLQGGAAWHVFRHTYGHDLEKMGLADREVMALMGHKNLGSSTTYMQSIREGRIPDATQQKLLAYREQQQKQAAEGAASQGVRSAGTCNTPATISDVVSSRRKAR